MMKKLKTLAVAVIAALAGASALPVQAADIPSHLTSKGGRLAF